MTYRKFLLTVFAVLFVTPASATFITLPSAFVGVDSLTIGDTTYHVGYTGSGTGERAGYVTSADPNTFHQLDMPSYNNQSGVLSRVTGIQFDGTVSFEVSFGPTSGTRVFTQNIIQGGDPSIIPTGSTSPSGAIFANGIVNGKVYGFTTSGEPFTAAINEAPVLLNSPIGRGTVRDGRNIDGATVLVGSVSMSSGFSGLSVWRDGVGTFTSCGEMFGCGLSDLDPTGRYAQVYLDNLIGYYDLSDDFYILPEFDGSPLLGLPSGIIAGENGPTLFYRNENDQFNLWVANSFLGINTSMISFCSLGIIDCDAFPTVPRDMGRINLVGGNPNKFDTAIGGSSYGFRLDNPDPVSAVPEPGSLILMSIGLGGLLASSKFGRASR